LVNEFRSTVDDREVTYIGNLKFYLSELKGWRINREKNEMIIYLKDKSIIKNYPIPKDFSHKP